MCHIISDWDPQYDADIEDLFTEGTWNSEFAGEIQQEEEDIILTNRSSFDAFVGTGLEKLLDENNLGYLFVGEFLSNLCVEESIYSADEIEGVSYIIYLLFLMLRLFQCNSIMIT